MINSADTGGGAYIDGDAAAGRDFVGRDQINLTLIGDLSAERLESVLPVLRDLLARRDTVLSAEPEPADLLRLTGTAGDTLLLSKPAAEALLLAAARRGDADAYLAALLVHPRYGRWVRRYVPLAGVLAEPQVPAGFADIVPDLTALEIVGEGAQRQVRRVLLPDITAALERHDAWVLLGEPGSGKTTSLHRLLIDGARERLQAGAGRLPLLLALADDRDYPSPHAFVTAVWRHRVGTDDLDARLRAGGLLLLVDALNEMPFRDAADYRARVGAWQRFVAEWPGNRFVFTCRGRDYSEPLGLPQVEIERLDDERVRAFLGRYVQRTKLAADAWQRLAGSPLLELVRNPFYLWILCWLVDQGKAWPSGRAGIFSGFVGHLLARERRQNHADWPGEAAVIAALAALAEGMQRLGEGTRLTRAEVLKRLPTRVETPDGPVDLDPKSILRLGLAATLLDTEADPQTGVPGGLVRFYHHQIQEFFAALALLDAQRGGLDLSDRWRSPRLKSAMPDPGRLRQGKPLPPPPTTGWEEPTLLAVGLARDPAALAALIAAVRSCNPVLAARCLAEPGVVAAADELALTQAALLADLGNPRVDVRGRIAAGEALGRLGDPRFEAIEVMGARVLLPPLVEVPAGVVRMGSSRWAVWRLVRHGYPAGDERPRHRVQVPAFAIGRFPVTNAEYGCFIADGGYKHDYWWDSPEAQLWRRGQLEPGYKIDGLNAFWKRMADPSLWDTRRRSEYAWEQDAALRMMDTSRFRISPRYRYTDRPMDSSAYWTEERLSNPAQPVVGVTWFEARAYCCWLNNRWHVAAEQASRPLPMGALVRLPTEDEWERAARLGSGRRFPWGNRWDPDRANTREGQVLCSTPVGAYPQGATPAGVQDLAGNCREWCVSRYRDYPVRVRYGQDDPGVGGRRVVRGGSWLDDSRVARCASRQWARADDFDAFVGFRVVLSLEDSGF
ncbi:SUMF1/EgtB/PvdO family nonheme iron enzyme [uncultured Thiodictyon sp.]|uniref:SUMF1/EgtB/PvdO family nonheme iron enzyme n=1 Tax=uncultured Thiodictyon sp. TaxID=1846217 RepID=UPI0025E506D3|nr:SUMF1/EgtB/PvdO family nonheme iron enzyme [uncultured Thiodictyon sp.]